MNISHSASLVLSLFQFVFKLFWITVICNLLTLIKVLLFNRLCLQIWKPCRIAFFPYLTAKFGKQSFFFLPKIIWERIYALRFSFYFYFHYQLLKIKVDRMFLVKDGCYCVLLVTMWVAGICFTLGFWTWSICSQVSSNSHQKWRSAEGVIRRWFDPGGAVKRAPVC